MITGPSDADSILDTVRQHLARAEAILSTDETPAAAAARAEIRAAMAQHESYARHLGHDLRNAITTISGQTQLLERQLSRDGLDRDRLRALLRRVIEATEHVTTVSRRISG